MHINLSMYCDTHCANKRQLFGFYIPRHRINHSSDLLKGLFVHALLRGTGGAMCRSDSKDYGRTWSTVYQTTLPNSNSGIDVTRLQDGTLVLAYNPTAGDGGTRSKLSLAISFDNGST
ncbi:MAG: exo-alpha-sialidase [Ginsengibacter sp.]